MNNYFSPRVPTKDNFFVNRNQRPGTVDTTDALNSLENSLEDKDFKMKMVSFIYINIRKILSLIVFCVVKESVIFGIVEKYVDVSWGL